MSSSEIQVAQNMRASSRACREANRTQQREQRIDVPKRLSAANG